MSLCLIGVDRRVYDWVESLLFAYVFGRLGRLGWFGGVLELLLLVEGQPGEGALGFLQRVLALEPFILNDPVC